jgi:hypothetical protein
MYLDEGVIRQSVDSGLSAARSRNQIRSTSEPGGPEEGVAISETCRDSALMLKSALEISPVETIGAGAAELTVKSASGE